MTGDVKLKISNDFRHKAPEAERILREAAERNDHVNQDRIIRCVIFLAAGDLNRLVSILETAAQDPRDVIFLAEYVDREQLHPKRVRDFNKTFDQCESDVSI